MGFLGSGLGLFFVKCGIWRCMWIFVVFDLYLKEDTIYLLFVSFTGISCSEILEASVRYLIIFFVNSVMLFGVSFQVVSIV